LLLLLLLLLLLQVLENVTSTGEADYSSMDGRCINPGHVIEAGWFLLDYAVTSGKDDLKKVRQPLGGAVNA